MPDVKVYSKRYCAYCWRAEALLSRKGVRYARIDVTGDRAARRWLVEATGRYTVPQIFINDEPIGGYRELTVLERRGELDRRLARDRG